MVRFMHLTLLLTLALTTACNMPKADSNTLSLEDQAGTLAAQTLTAVAEQVPTETPVPLSTPTQALPTITPAPTLLPTPTVQITAPKKPSLENYNFTCTWNGANLDLNITIDWVDYADNEQGYYIYRNSQQIADLAPNSARYTDLHAIDGGVAVNYEVEAYNSLGRSEKINISAKCE